MDEEQDFVCALSLDETHSGLADLWHQGVLVDTVLVADDGVRLPCHRVVLAAASPFFRALFSDQWSHDGASSEAHLLGVTSPVLHALVSAVYTRKLVAPPSQLPALLAGAMQLALQPLATACSQQLIDRLCPSNTLGVASLASALGVWPLERDAEAFAAQHFADVLREDAEGVTALPVDRLERLLSADSLLLVEEADALDTLLEWASCSEAQASSAVMHTVPMGQERIRELPRLLRRVRLCLVPRNELLSRARGHPACMACPEARSMLERAAQESARIGAGYSGQPRSAVPLRLLAIGGHDVEWRPLRSCEVYDTRTDSWQPAGMLPQNYVSAFFSAVAGQSASSTRELLAIGGSTFACATLRADVPPPAPLLSDDNCTDSAGSMLLLWSPRGTPTARQHAALACVDAFQMPSLAYLIGGRAGAVTGEMTLVERTALGAVDEWTRCPSLSSPRASGAAATLQDVVYVAGGQSGRQTLDTCEVLHAGSHEWVCLPSAVLCQPRKYLSLVTLRGCLYAVGGMRETRARLASVERLDPRDGRWRTIAPMNYRRSSAGVVAAAGALWASGGNDGETHHCSTERYDDRMDAWTLMAPMTIERSGAAMVAI